MALLPITHYPHPVLKEKAKKVEDFGPEMQKFFDDMIETMYVEDGVGLAAPQVGVSKQIFIVSPAMKRGEEQVIVNPEIYEYSEEAEKGLEGCLSFPGISGMVLRSKRIRVRYQDRDGKPHDIEAKDFFARVIQHENDHLIGMLLIDRVDFDTRQRLLAEYDQAS